MINDALILIIYENIGKMDNSTVIKGVNNNEFVFFAFLTCQKKKPPIRSITTAIETTTVEVPTVYNYHSLECLRSRKSH